MLLLCGAPLAFAEDAPKKKVASEADLPRHSYPVWGLASKLVQADNATFGAFASKVRADIDAELRDYDIKDGATLRDLLSTRLGLQMVAGDYQDALGTVETLRALQDKASTRLTSGLVSRAFLKTAIATKTTEGAAFDRAFAQQLGEELAPLPWGIVQDWAKRVYAGARLSAPASALASIMSDIDPAVQKSNALNDAEAADLVQARAYIQMFIPIATAEAAVLKGYIASHESLKPDIWAAREVTFSSEQKLTPVLVAVWDGGVDVDVFPNQLFTDPNPTASGTHGLAFDEEGIPSATWLNPLTREQLATYPEVRDEIKGRQDIREGRDSPEATALEKKMKTRSPEELHQFVEIERVVHPYMHGTHCAGIAVRGNPAARLVVFRFNDSLPSLKFAPTVEWARRLAGDFKQMSDYCRTRGVRVVNMSWGDDRQEFELWLSKTGGGGDPQERKARAAELYAIWRAGIEDAIRSAPGTLFVASAGNSDSNTGFTESVPAALRFPNLITVGALNQAGEETSFTSYGESVVVHADGYDVESFVPGGARLPLSGTSMAAPGVVNLAAKLFALDPSLTPEEAISLIEKGADASADGRRHLVSERRSVELLGSRRAN